MKTGALHHPTSTPPARMSNTDRHGLSGPGSVRQDPANQQDTANQDTAAPNAPAARRHDVDAFGGTAEPALVDILNEPIVRTMMRRDGVALATLQRVMGDARLVSTTTDRGLGDGDGGGDGRARLRE